MCSPPALQEIKPGPIKNALMRGSKDTMYPKMHFSEKKIPAPIATIISAIYMLVFSEFRVFFYMNAIGLKSVS